VNGRFPGEQGSASSPSVLFLHLFQRRTLEDKRQGFFMGCYATNNVKALTPTRGLAFFFLHLPSDYHRRSVATFMMAFQCYYYYYYYTVIHKKRGRTFMVITLEKLV